MFSCDLLTYYIITSQCLDSHLAARHARTMTRSEHPKEKCVLEKAAEVFTRYGYARTTMADIASKAGMSRPALYLIFPDKQVIFDQVIRDMDMCMLSAIRAKIEKVPNLREKLTAACMDWGLHPAELAAMHPDAADLFDLRFPAVQQAYAHFETLIAAMIGSEVERSGICASPAELARVLVFGMRGVREAASDTQGLRRMIEVQVEVVVRALQVP